MKTRLRGRAKIKRKKWCHKDFHDKSTQTNFDLPQELQGIKEDLQRLKEENDKLKAKLDDKETLKRELFMGDVLKNDPFCYRK